MEGKEVERLRVQSHSDLEKFVKKFAKKYRPLFRNGTFCYRFHPNLAFLYAVYLEIQLAEWAAATFTPICAQRIRVIVRTLPCGDLNVVMYILTAIEDYER